MRNLFRRKPRKASPSAPAPDPRHARAIEAIDKLGQEAAEEILHLELLRLADRKASRS